MKFSFNPAYGVFRILILEYFLTRGKGILSNVIICVIISFVFYKMGSEKSIAIETSKTAVDLLGILLGFTISLFAIILSVDNEIINKDIPMFEIGIVYNNANTFNNNKLIIEISYNELIDVCKLFIDNLSLSRDYMHNIIKEDLYDTIMDL